MGLVAVGVCSSGAGDGGGGGAVMGLVAVGVCSQGAGGIGCVQLRSMRQWVCAVREHEAVGVCS